MTYGCRLRRISLWIYGILGASWLAKNSLFPEPALSFEEFLLRGAVGPFSGQVVILLGVLYFGVLALIAIGTIGMTRATGEILPRFSGGDGHDPGGEDEE
jgi:uncharacterized membrane protein